jgi:hypothetical protein
MLDEHAAALQADIDAKEARENEKAVKADKKKRKSEAKIEVEDVEMEDADAAPKKSSKKRKKEAESDDEETEKVRAPFANIVTRSDSDDSLQRPRKPPKSS